MVGLQLPALVLPGRFDQAANPLCSMQTLIDGSLLHWQTPITMAPLPTPKLSFDIIAIGGGTAGSGVIRYASRYGKKAAVVELKKGYGGTCGESAAEVLPTPYHLSDPRDAPDLRIRQSKSGEFAEAAFEMVKFSRSKPLTLIIDVCLRSSCGS